MQHKLKYFCFSALMEPFLKSYYDEFKYKSIDSNQFKEYFLNYFKDKDLSAIEWDKWFHEPGMPLYKPNYDQSFAIACAELSKKWVNWNMESEPCPFTTKVNIFIDQVLFIFRRQCSLIPVRSKQAIYKLLYL